jgi:hypothetical protein
MAGWNDAADLQRFLTAAGYSYDDLELGHALAAAQSEIEQRTGWRPFYATTQTRYYTLDSDRELFLDAGLLTCTSVTIDGSAQVKNTDFWLMPENADLCVPAQPWTLIEFGAERTSARRGCVIVGSWGRAASMPDDVLLAQLCRAASLVAPQVASKVSGGALEWREGDVTEKHGGLAKDAEAWEAQFAAVCRRYARARVW